MCRAAAGAAAGVRTLRLEYAIIFNWLQVCVSVMRKSTQHVNQWKLEDVFTFRLLEGCPC